MLAILTTHPIQYQVPIWQALARDGRVPFEVWYMSDHATRVSHDVEFGTKFAWDIDLLSGYPHQFLQVPDKVHPASFWHCRMKERLRDRLRANGVKVLWIQGWQVAGYWQAVHEARCAGVEIWLRGESNDLAPVSGWKKIVKRVVLGQLFRRVGKFLCIGTANRRLYRQFGVPEAKLLAAPYAVDNARFRRQKAEIEKQKAEPNEVRPTAAGSPEGSEAHQIEKQKLEIRKRWGIADNAFCVLFCGKFIPKKRPLDLVQAASLLIEDKRLPNVHLLFTGSGELGNELRAACQVVFDAESDPSTIIHQPSTRPPASFAGFLNQTQISEAYVAADCLVLPSDFGETWGLVVNEALASGLPCIISDHCGSAEDLGARPPNQIFPCGDSAALADRLCWLAQSPEAAKVGPEVLHGYSFDHCVQSVVDAYQDSSS
ncbi:MAG: glycosyltransferase family 4 protein [Prosthecobacter sp.]|uniref:glycosyltransferase family 4 protein n=1 Tax=Prosthecobacter sp. TaxID=1965333 RepID=UPI0039019A6C